MKTEIDYIRGIIHVHSSYSRDGDMAIPELKEFCLDFGLSFAFLTDHAEDMSEHDVEQFVRDCDMHSDDNFHFIPGLEFSLDDHTHVLAPGLRHKPSSTRRIEMLQEIRSAGALLILAHPLFHGNGIDHGIYDFLDGLEVWNGSHDGGFFPDPAVLRFFRNISQRIPHIIAYGGDDLHRRDEKVRVKTLLPKRYLGPNIITALRSGNFAVRGKLWSLDSKPAVRIHSTAALQTSYGAYLTARKLRDYFGHRQGAEG